jgi:hypothetical protein
MTTDERIENLEKGLASARRLNRGLLVAVGLALGVGVLAAGNFWPKIAAALAGGGAVKEVRANRFVVEDENGKTRVVLSMIAAGMAVAPASGDGPVLTLYDENGKPRAHLGMDKTGLGLNLHDENGKPRVVLVVANAGSALILYDENGKSRALLDVAKNGPGLTLADENGKIRAGLVVAKEKVTLVTLGLYDENGKPRVGLGMDEYGPRLNFLDDNGKPIWQAPQSAPVAVTPGTK